MRGSLIELYIGVNLAPSLKKKFMLQYKEAEGSSYRDGAYAETPGTPPKHSQRAADLDRTCTPDPTSFVGERFGKRDQKRKGSGRLAEAPSSPAQSKRPRKFKASD